MLTFPMPLGHKPRLRSIGRGVHGQRSVERYRLQGLWCLHLYRYHARLSVNGEELEIKPGDLGIVPADAELVYWFKGRSEHLFAHFFLDPCEELSEVPALHATGPHFTPLQQRFEEAVGMFPRQPFRAEVRLWDLLWHVVAEREQTPADALHPAVREIIGQIELRLHEPLLVESLAREVELSHNHLTRLFQQALGQSVKGYMQTRRMEKTLHLLTMSSKTIKSIACDVGFEDLHAFNKAVRRHFGKPPRALREAAHSVPEAIK